MKRPDVDNPIFDIGCDVAELYKIADIRSLLRKRKYCKIFKFC